MSSARVLAGAVAGTVPVRSASKSTAVAMPQRLHAPDQWAKLNGILARAVGGAAAAGQLQASATQQLDLAQYGLTTLVDELSAVMTIPGRKSRTASLHVFGAGGDAADVAMADAALAHNDRQAMAA